MANKMMMIAMVMMCIIVVTSPMAEANISCGFVLGKIGSCITYLESTGAAPPSAACCDGVKALNSAAVTTPDRQTACQCLQKASASFGNKINPGLAAGLPGKCGVTIPYKISPSTDCSKVH